MQINIKERVDVNQDGPSLIIEASTPFTYWLNGRWFLQIVERDSWNLYPLYPLFPCYLPPAP